jgi:signal transduction histidine kinase/CheY-like chemotaxis protein
MATKKPTYKELEKQISELKEILKANELLKKSQYDTHNELRDLEWMLKKNTELIPSNSSEDIYIAEYGDLIQLNTNRLILDSVGEELLQDIAKDYLNLLGSSSAIYEKNGDYAFGIFSSGWCQLMDKSSRRLCKTDDNKVALNSGKWLCHESCWSKASKTAINSACPVDIECAGGIRTYAVPIFAGEKIIGAINFGYGDPPKSEEKLLELSKKFKINLTTLKNASSSYEVRPPYIIELAKKRLLSSARQIGEITQRKIIETELIKTKEKVEENEKRYRSMFDSMQEGIYLHELIYDNKGKAINYRIIDANPISEKYLNIKPEDAIGKLATKLYGTEEAPFLKEYSTVAETGEPFTFEQFFAPMNKHFLISVFSPRKGKFATAFLDISKIKKYETELVDAKEKAEESNRLKTAFLQNMSHEIRTPLNAISGFSEMLKKPNLSDEKRNSFISIIQNSGHQLVSIITDILTISALETNQEKINITDVCINNIIEDLYTIFKNQSSNKQISLFKRQILSNKQSEIYTDKTKITQILTNLLSNALKFTHEGFVDFGYNLKTDQNPVELEFYVKDTGIGIDIKEQKRIFERFLQADLSIYKKYGGTGLGLSISQSFVNMLGGKIWVQSEPYKGSTFFFTIPYDPVNKEDPNVAPEKQSKNLKTILVAEDDEFNYIFIEELLISEDIKLIHAKNGKETVEMCKSNPNIDLVLMDIKMPIMNGYDAAILIKGVKPDLTIIALSAYALEHEIEKYNKIFADYLTKPVNSKILINKLNKYLYR